MEKLHQLIASMTPAEKQFFGRFSQWKKGDKKYLKLFRQIGKMKTYDEELLRRQLQDPLLEKNLAAHKYALWHQLMRSMRLMHDESDTTHKLKNQLGEIAILFRKGLFSQALDMLAKAIYLAEQYERFEDMHTLYRQEEFCLLMLNRYDELVKRGPEIQQKKAYALQCCRNIDDFQQIYFHLLDLAKGGQVNKAGQLLLLLKHPLLQAEEQALCYQSKTFYYEIRSILHRLNGDMEASLREKEADYGMCQRYPLITGDDPRALLNTLHNLTSAYLYRRNYEKFLHYLGLFKALPGQTGAYWKEFIHHRVTINSVLMELTYYQETTRYAEGAGKIAGYVSILPKDELERLPEHHMAILFSMACVYLGASQPNPCLQMVNQVLRHKPFRSYRRDILYAALVMKMVVYLQKYDTAGFRLLVKEFDIFILQSGIQLESAGIFRNIMRLFSQPQPKKERIQRIQEAILQLEQITSEHREEQPILRNFDYLDWMRKLVA